MSTREPIVWESESGAGARTAWLSPLAVIAVIVVAAVFVAESSMGTSATQVVMALVFAALGGGLALPLLLLRRDRFSLTPTRLVMRVMPAGMTSVPIDHLAGVERLERRRLVLTFAHGQRVMIGPLDGADELGGLLEDAISERIDLHALPGIDGESAEAEWRSDVFVSATSAGPNGAGGPLVVGPKLIVHFEKPLPAIAQARLLTDLARASERVEAEAHARSAARANPSARPVVIEHERASARIEDSALCFRGEHGESRVLLAPERLDRLELLLERMSHGPFR